MKPEFAQDLRCPACLHDHSLELLAQESDAREVREGTLRCSVCATEFPVHKGVMELLHEPPSYVVAEAAGLERFAEQMAAEGWDREKVRKLPDIEHGYWYTQSRSMHQLMTTIPFRSGQSLLDVGSNTCWAANRFAERGLQVTALDIATTELQGLYTAEYFIDEGEVFFERVLGSMAAIPLASASLDYVYCCEVLHHNDPQSLRRTFQEIFRVLRPGGRLLMVNETLKTLSDPDGVHVEGVEQFEGYEHAHWALGYRWEAIRAGFITEVTEPHYRPFFGDPTPLAPRCPRAAFGTVRAQGGEGASLEPCGAPHLPVLAEPRTGGRADEHDRHQARALCRYARADQPFAAPAAHARGCHPPAYRSARGQGCVQTATDARAGGRWDETVWSEWCLRAWGRRCVCCGG